MNEREGEGEERRKMGIQRGRRGGRRGWRKAIREREEQGREDMVKIGKEKAGGGGEKEERRSHFICY